MSDYVRTLWTLAEPFHALTYFAPESHRAFEAAGLRGFWRGYFAGRAAPFGTVGAGVVTATFFGFHPAFVARAVPGVWDVVTPAVAIDARLAGISAAVDAHLDPELVGDVSDAVCAPLRAAIEQTPVDGRALFGANVSLPWPDAPALALWHAVTLLREHRGDGHVDALVAAGIDPCEAHVLRVADDGVPLDSIQPYRGWSETDWADAAARLRARGWLDAAGSTTRAGHDARADVEDRTDRLSAPLVERLDDVDRVIAALRPLADRIGESGVVPYPNPVGVPAPRAPRAPR
jgi:hypothetical protein